MAISTLEKTKEMKELYATLSSEIKGYLKDLSVFPDIKTLRTCIVVAQEMVQLDKEAGTKESERTSTHIQDEKQRKRETKVEEKKTREDSKIMEKVTSKKEVENETKKNKCKEEETETNIKEEKQEGEKKEEKTTKEEIGEQETKRKRLCQVYQIGFDIAKMLCLEFKQQKIKEKKDEEAESYEEYKKEVAKYLEVFSPKGISKRMFKELLAYFKYEKLYVQKRIYVEFSLFTDLTLKEKETTQTACWLTKFIFKKGVKTLIENNFGKEGFTKATAFREFLEKNQPDLIPNCFAQLQARFNEPNDPHRFSSLLKEITNLLRKHLEMFLPLPKLKRARKTELKEKLLTQIFEESSNTLFD